MSEKIDVERPCVELARAHGYKDFKFDRPGGAKGWPDAGFWGPGGRHFLVEFKVPGGRLRPLQRHYSDWFLTNEHWYHVITSVDDFKALLAKRS